MKIVNIVPGFGGTFYCGNCLRDNVYVNALREMGHDAVTLPMYLPLTMAGEKTSPDAPVFYGAVNIYLKQQFPLFRHMPGWMEHMFNSKPMLKFAAKKSGSTRAHGLEELTESMLLGQEGHQNRELYQLVTFLKHHEKPDVVHFSNALLLGLARQIKDELNIPVVCSLQDEDVWVDAMQSQWRSRIWSLMASKGNDVDAFISVSNWFATVMQQNMGIDPSKIHVVPIGIKPDNYKYAVPASNPPAVGYLSRICEENGFAILIDAFILLKKEPRFASLRLHATGGMTGDDQSFIREQQRKLESHGLSGFFSIMEEFTTPDLSGFFEHLTVLSVPVLKGEAFGLYQLEALASGVPLVQPELGAFPEIINATGGGVIYHPNTAEALAESLAKTLVDQAALVTMSHKGREAVERQFNSRKLTADMVQVYQKIIRNR